MAVAAQILEAVKISDVYRALGGATLPGGRRGIAFWRDGANGFNVALNDEKGTWFDHAAGAGGGLLDLVVKAHGGTKHEGLRYLAALAGIDIDDSSAAAVRSEEHTSELQSLRHLV